MHLEVVIKNGSSDLEHWSSVSAGLKLSTQ